MKVFKYFIKDSKMQTNSSYYLHDNPGPFGTNILTPQTIGHKIYDFMTANQISFGLSRKLSENLARALILFVAYHPPSMAAKLFFEEEGANEPIENVYMYMQELEKKKLRNWKYVVSKMLDLTYLEGDCEASLLDNELFRLSTIKATASIIAELISLHKYIENIFATLIGYWMAKLYSISVFRANPNDLPEPLPAMHSRFLQLYGNKYRTKSPEFGFNPHMFESREAMLKLFPFLKERVASQPVKLPGRNAEDSFQRRAVYLWNYFGDECLKHYISNKENDPYKCYKEFAAEKVTQTDGKDPVEHDLWKKRLEQAERYMDQFLFPAKDE